MAINRPAEVVAADLRARVLEAQRALETLDADVHIIERGWHPEVPVRTFSGTLRYRAPESVALQVVDETRYPSSAWRNNDNDLVITEGRWWSRGPGACPVQLQPRCSLNQPRLRVLTQREPFAEESPAPLDLVLPARSFNVPTGTTELRTATVAGQAAIGLRTTVAQVTPILSGLRTVGNWRELYPGDEVELWLDEDHLVPLELTVRPAAGAERGRWQAEHGYRDTDRHRAPRSVPRPRRDQRPAPAGELPGRATRRPQSRRRVRREQPWTRRSCPSRRFSPRGCAPIGRGRLRRSACGRGPTGGRGSR